MRMSNAASQKRAANPAIGPDFREDDSTLPVLSLLITYFMVEMYLFEQLCRTILNFILFCIRKLTQE